MSNYEQMELNITLDEERELKENVMLSVEFAYDQLKSYDLPNVANRYEGYGIAANMWSQLAAKEKGVKDSMKHFLVTLDIGEQAAIEEGNDDGFEEVEGKAEEKTEAEVQEDGAE